MPTKLYIAYDTVNLRQVFISLIKNSWNKKNNYIYVNKNLQLLGCILCQTFHFDKFYFRIFFIIFSNNLNDFMKLKIKYNKTLMFYIIYYK